MPDFRHVRSDEKCDVVIRPGVAVEADLANLQWPVLPVGHPDELLASPLFHPRTPENDLLASKFLVVQRRILLPPDKDVVSCRALIVNRFEEPAQSQSFRELLIIVAWRRFKKKGGNGNKQRWNGIQFLPLWFESNEIVLSLRLFVQSNRPCATLFLVLERESECEEKCREYGSDR